MEELIMSLLPLILVIGAILFSTVLRVVPSNSLIIVDRNTHYLKTKRHGFYFINPKTDKVTTHISTYPLTRYYSNYFETHDGRIVQVSFWARYHAKNLDDVTYALASARRSVNDIIEGSVYWGVKKLMASDFHTNSSLLLNEVKPYLISEATELKITINEFSITNVRVIPYATNIIPFKPHLSSSSSGPIKYS